MGLVLSNPLGLDSRRMSSISRWSWSASGGGSPASERFSRGGGLAEVRSGRSTCRVTSAPQPTSARHVDQGTAQQHAADTEREVLQGGLTAWGIKLAAFQDGGIESKKKEPRDEQRRRSRRQADDCRRAKPGHKMFSGAAKRSPRHAVRRRPSEDRQSNDATS